MIELNLKINGDTIYCNCVEIEKHVDVWVVYSFESKEFDTLEKAVKYCMEQSK